MPVSEPPVGGSISIQIHGQQEGEFFRTKVADVNESHLFIDIPVHVGSGKEMSARIGEMLSIEYGGDGGEVYRYSSQVLGLSYIPTPALRLVSPSKAPDLERVQRRQFYRTSLDTQVQLTRPDGNTYQLQAVDISGGGIAVKCKVDLGFTWEETVRLNLVLPYIDYRLDVPCRVIRSENVEASTWIVSMIFVEIPERDRQQVVRYTFMRQRSMRR